MRSKATATRKHLSDDSRNEFLIANSATRGNRVCNALLETYPSITSKLRNTQINACRLPFTGYSRNPSQDSLTPGQKRYPVPMPKATENSSEDRTKSFPQPACTSRAIIFLLITPGCPPPAPLPFTPLSSTRRVFCSVFTHSE